MIKDNRDLIVQRILDACPSNREAVMDITLDTMLTVGRADRFDLVAYLKLQLTISSQEDEFRTDIEEDDSANYISSNEAKTKMLELVRDALEGRNDSLPNSR